MNDPEKNELFGMIISGNPNYSFRWGTATMLVDNYTVGTIIPADKLRDEVTTVFYTSKHKEAFFPTDADSGQ